MRRNKKLRIAEYARCNRKSIDIAAYFFSKADYHTDAVMEIAQLAAAADHEIAHLDEIMELVIISGSNTVPIASLAEKAANGTISESDLTAEIASYRVKAEAKTVDQAIELYG